MTGWLTLPNLVLSISALLLMLLGLAVVIVMPDINRWGKQFYIVFFTILVLCSFSYVIDMLVVGRPHLAWAEKATVYFESLLSSILIPMLTLYLLHCCNENWKRSTLMRVVLVLWCIYFMLLNITQFTSFIYYISPDNQYYRGPWYPLLLVPPIVTMAINLVAVIRRRTRLSRKHFIAFTIYIVFPIVGMLIQMLVYGLLFIAFSMAISALLMFGIVLSDQIEQYMAQQREIAQQRASILVLQMRPHFIYNTMMSIYYLCDQDPKKAQQVTLDFTTYLRKNFTAIASEKTISFAEELEHTRAYLAVEQAQFEDRLFVVYDTPHVMFHVPPLTLQPIVENAVKHGMDPDGDPLRITIRTREVGKASEIEVEDNGPGFEPSEDDEPHIALNNIRQRLEMMCGGQLVIEPREGGGTVVRVKIPGVSGDGSF